MHDCMDHGHEYVLSTECLIYIVLSFTRLFPNESPLQIRIKKKKKIKDRNGFFSSDYFVLVLGPVIWAAAPLNKTSHTRPFLGHYSSDYKAARTKCQPGSSCLKYRRPPLALASFNYSWVVANTGTLHSNIDYVPHHEVAEGQAPTITERCQMRIWHCTRTTILI
jgi:hypothetical protein